MKIIWAPHRCGQCGFTSQKLVDLNRHIHYDHSESEGYFYDFRLLTAFPKWNYAGSRVKVDVHTQTEEVVSVKVEHISTDPEIKVEDNIEVKTEMCETDIDLQKDFELIPTSQKEVTDIGLEFCEQSMPSHGTGMLEDISVHDHGYCKTLQHIPLLDSGNMQVEELNVLHEMKPMKQIRNKRGRFSRERAIQSKTCRAEVYGACIESQPDLNVLKEDQIPMEHKTATNVIKEANQNCVNEMPVKALEKNADTEFHKEELSNKNTNLHKCSDCGYSCAAKNILMVHISKYCEKSKKVKFVEKDTHKYTCKACSYSCSTETILMTHIARFCKKSGCRLCEICGIVMPDTLTLFRHKISCKQKAATDHLKGLGTVFLIDTNNLFKYHGKPKALFKTCDICGMEVANETGLMTRHKITCYRKNYICDTCGAAYRLPFQLRRHQLVHSGERPFVCDQCGKAFRSKPQLFIHQRYVHSGEKNFKCDQCGKSFITKQRLIRHVRTHVNVLLYKCHFCERKFSSSWNRKAHMRQHTGTKPYSCSKCGESFAHNVSRKTHQLKCLFLRDCNDDGIQNNTDPNKTTKI